jgi:hypothetical protein
MIGSWMGMGACAIWLTVAFFRNLSESTPGQPMEVQSAPA